MPDAAKKSSYCAAELIYIEGWPPGFLRHPVVTFCRYRLHIVGEVSMDVQHCLVAWPGVQRGDIRRVMSHPQALAQCTSFLQQWPDVVREAVTDTAVAAKTIAQHGMRCATLAAA